MNSECSRTGNNGPRPSRYRRAAAAVALAMATGTKLRGFHSNSSSSTASRTEASGAANVADMPAAAPATSSVFRSALVRSEEHTSELQSLRHLVCRLLLEKKKKNKVD